MSANNSSSRSFGQSYRPIQILCRHPSAKGEFRMLSSAFTIVFVLPTHSPPLGFNLSHLLSHQVFDVLIVFLADVFDQFAPKQRRMRRERPRLREGLRVVNDVDNLEVTEVRAC